MLWTLALLLLWVPTSCTSELYHRELAPTPYPHYSLHICTLDSVSMPILDWASYTKVITTVDWSELQVPHLQCTLVLQILAQLPKWARACPRPLCFCSCACAFAVDPGSLTAPQAPTSYTLLTTEQWMCLCPGTSATVILEARAIVSLHMSVHQTRAPWPMYCHYTLDTRATGSFHVLQVRSGTKSIVLSDDFPSEKKKEEDPSSLCYWRPQQPFPLSGHI